MPSALVIPGVQVTTLFEPSPVLPGATGILGVVGIADRGPLAPTPIGSFGELVDLFGAASRYSMPEVREALANGVSQVVVARLDPGRGQKATLNFLDDEGNTVITLEARAEGAWGNHLAARVSQVKTLSGHGIKYVNLEISLDGQVIETLNNLVLDEDSPDYLFDRINGRSRVVVAYDPHFAKALPSALAKTDLADSDARAAFVLLKAGAADVVRVDAKRVGRAGNQVALRVSDGRASLPLPGAANAAGAVVRARQAGTAGTGFRVSVAASAPSSVNLVVTPPAANPPVPPRTLGPFATVDDLVKGFAGDPDLLAEAAGKALPAAVGATPLARTATIDVIPEGRDTATYADLADGDAVQAIVDPVVNFTKVAGQVPVAGQLPDAGVETRLAGGRNKGPALSLAGDASDQPLVEIAPAPGVAAKLAVKVDRAISTADHATPVVNLSIFADGNLAETWSNLTMDPDDPNYLPAVLEGSALVRAHDLFVRGRSSALPANMARPQPLKGGVSPLPDDYQTALDRLEQAEEVDLVIASVANQLDDAGVRAVHKAVVAHCTKMADVARNRIGLGAVTGAEAGQVALVLDHANDVRSDYFVLTTPAATVAAFAGLLGRQNYFESPTFKTIANLEAPAGRYTDSQLIQLVQGNVLVINERRSLGVIAIKGLLTSGRQINVQRTANQAVREVKAIANVYIGLLNNEGARNALRQQITAALLQMERDGALVPSTDGKDPAFKVDVYSAQADFANGIVRVDIAVRPVHAIDYIYATILVQN
jgi:hypothetical protein